MSSAASLRGYVNWRWAPHVTLGVGLALVFVYAARIGARVDIMALDETLLKQSAVHDTTNLPHSVLHDLNARASSRLYSLVLSIVFRIWDGDAAVRAAKVFNVAMFLSTAWPVWLLAREFLASKWKVAAAAGLSVAAPWLAITTAIYTENLAYPLFAWSLVAMVWCLRKPSWWRDLVVVGAMLALVGTRVQFASIFVCWFAAIAIVHGAEAWGAGSWWARAKATGRTMIVRHPFGVGAIAIAFLYAVELKLTHRLHSTLAVDLGRYSELQDRPGITSDFFPSLLIEVVNFTVATGVLPVVAAFAWWYGALGRRGEDRGRWNATVAVAATGIGTTLATIYVQGGYLGANTEERYYMYLVPLLWIGALAAIGAPWIRRSWLAAAGGLVVIACATMPLLDPIAGHEYIFLAPAGTVVGHWALRVEQELINGFSERDMVALFAMAALAVGLWFWRSGRARLVVWIVIPAVIQLAVAGYAFAVIDGQVDPQYGNVGTGAQFRALAWVDRQLPHGTPVTWIDNQRKPLDLSAENTQRVVLFWNQDISHVGLDAALGIPPVSYPLNTTDLKPLVVDQRTGVVTSAAPMNHLVVAVGSPFLQIAAKRVLATSGQGLAMIVPGTPPMATWQATGLGQDGTVPVARTAPARLRAWGSGEIGVTMTFTTPGAAAATVSVSLGGHRRRVAVQPGIQGATVQIDAGCASYGHPRTGTLAAIGATQLVDVTPAITGPCSS